MSSYSNFQAFRALVKASLQSIAKSPSAIVFNIAFPMIFILVFGFLGEGRQEPVRVISAPGNDTTLSLFRGLHQAPGIKWVEAEPQEEKALRNGKSAVTLQIREQPEGVTPRYEVVLRGSASDAAGMQQLSSIIREAALAQDEALAARISELAEIKTELSETRPFRSIDFILPGQLGFSLLAGSIFGTAFVFFNMRQTLVLKRFFATPVRREVILLSEGAARMCFQLFSAIIIIGVGYLAFDYTLVHGLRTFVELLALSMIAIMVFMGFGFTISGLARNESSIPPFANMITLPQFLLAGTFFPVDSFPQWLQPVSRALPLTYLNDAMRRVAFDGASLWQVRSDILILLIWGAFIYFIAGRVFKWE